MKYNSIGEQLIAKAKEIDPNYRDDKFNDMSEALDIILNNSGNGDNFIDLVINVEQFESWVNPDTWNLTIPANNITTDMLLSIAQDDKKGILFKITMPHSDEEGQDVLCATIPFYCDFLTGAFFTNVTNIFGKIGCWVGSVNEVGQDQVFKFHTTAGSKIWYDLDSMSGTITQDQYDEIKALVDTNSLAGLAFKTLYSYFPLTYSLDDGTFVFSVFGLGLESTGSDRKNAIDDSNITIKSDLSITFSLEEIFFPVLTQNLSSQSIISIKTDGYQENLTIGNGLTIENGVIKEDIIEINVSFELTQEDLKAGAVWKTNVGTIDEGKKIWNSINSSTGLPKKAIINISLNLLGTTDLYKILANPYKDNISCGYNFNIGGFTDSSYYLFVYGAIYINDGDDTIDAHLAFKQNLAQ